MPLRAGSARLREVTFIGAGSSIAYLANEMAGRFEGVGADQPLLGKVSVIGVEDAWSPSVRGQGYINHQNEIIGQWGERAPAYDPGYADRANSPPAMAGRSADWNRWAPSAWRLR